MHRELLEGLTGGVEALEDDELMPWVLLELGALIEVEAVFDFEPVEPEALGQPQRATARRAIQRRPT